MTEKRQKQKQMMKGKAPASYVQGTSNNFANLPKEKLQEYGRKSGETRRRKKEEKQMLQKCMREILNMKISSTKQKEVLKEMGFKSEQLTNETLLMVALFRKGLTGDVPAIKEVINMMDKLDLIAGGTGSGASLSGVTINVIQDGTGYVPSAEVEKEIMEVENGQFTDIMIEESEDDWGNDIYEP